MSGRMDDRRGRRGEPGPGPRRVLSPPPVPNPAQQALAAADRWAQENQALLEACFEAFSTAGEWPTVEALQHAFEVAGVDIDVSRLGWQMPGALGSVEQGRLVLFCRALTHVPGAAPLLDRWYRAVELAYRKWLADPESKLRSEEVGELVGGDPDQARLVSTVLLREGWMLGSGTGLPDGDWTREITSAVRVAKGAKDASELLEARGDVETRDLPPALPVFEEEPTVLPLAAAVPSAPAGAPPKPSREDRDGRVGRAWRYATGNPYLATLSAAGTLALIGVCVTLLRGAL
jgi:hypothetical protein